MKKSAEEERASDYDYLREGLKYAQENRYKDTLLGFKILTMITLILSIIILWLILVGKGDGRLVPWCILMFGITMASLWIRTIEEKKYDLWQEVLKLRPELSDKIVTEADFDSLMRVPSVLKLLRKSIRKDDEAVVVLNEYESEFLKNEPV